MDGYLEVVKNDKLGNLAGLGNLKAVQSKAKISENDMLGSLKGLGTLEKIGSLEIVLNKSIKSLSGLGIKEIAAGNGYAITIGLNESLTSLDGLAQLVKSTDGRSITIRIYRISAGLPNCLRPIMVHFWLWITRS